MRILLLTLTAFIISSCAQYQYMMVSSDQLPKNSQQEFIAESDTAKITYRFNGKDGAVSITIHNKLAEPLEIDWRKSALIIQGEAKSYFSSTIRMNGTARIDTIPQPSAQLSGVLVMNEPVEFIPPNASFTRVPLNLSVNSFTGSSLETQQKQTYQISPEVSAKYRMLQFNAQESPFNFRSYLSFKTGKSEKEFFVEHRFFVSEIWQSNTPPDQFPPKFTNQGNVFYVMSQ